MDIKVIQVIVTRFQKENFQKPILSKNFNYKILSDCVHSASKSDDLDYLLTLTTIYEFKKGRSVARCPEPRYLINKLIKQQEQIYHLHL